MSDGREVLYQVPWICHQHGYITMKKEDFFGIHMTQVEHFHEGTGGTCESCGKYLPTFKTRYEGMSEPRIDLCSECQLIPNIRNLIRDKRKSRFKLLDLEKNMHGI